MKKITLSILFYLILLHALAQQNTQYGQYVFNGLYINPAYAGHKDKIYLQAFVRTQWTGIQGAPQSFSVSLDAPVPKTKIGLGTVLTKDKIGAQSSTNATANISYYLNFSEEGSKILAFGFGIGVLQSSINGGLLNPVETGDKSIPTGLESRNVADIRAGLQYSTEKFFIGFSANNLLPQYLILVNDDGILSMKVKPHFYLTVAKVFQMNQDIVLKPSILIKDDINGPTSLDLSTLLLIRNKIWIGGLYRTSAKLYPKNNLQHDLSNKSAVGFIVEFFAKPNLRLGYGYDHSLNKLRTYDNGSHELSVGFYLNNTKSQKKVANYF